MVIITIINTAVLSMLGGIHLYWASGGTWAYKYIIPADLDKRLSFNPGRIGALIVGVGLLILAMITLADTGLFPIESTYTRFGLYAMSIIFLARTIGDFRLIGLFKRNTHSLFARYDTKFFTPLCAYLSISSLLLAIS